MFAKLLVDVNRNFRCCRKSRAGGRKAGLVTKKDNFTGGEEKIGVGTPEPLKSAD